MPPHRHDSLDRDWQTDLYSSFEEHRTRPARDLLARVPLAGPTRVVDLGCGTGTSTALLLDRWPEAEVWGVDHSPAMLEKARERLGAEMADRLVLGDLLSWLEGWAGEPIDLVFSNAALHWLPDHRGLFPKLIRSLAAGGALAVQMPLSWHQPSHRLMRELLTGSGPKGQPLGSPELRERLGTPPVATAGDYYRWLAPHCDHLDLWETELLQPLSGDEPVFEWVRSTGLRPVLDELEGETLELYLERYRAALLETYPPEPNGVTLFPFRRLYLVVRRSDTA